MAAPNHGYCLVQGTWCDLPTISPAERTIALRALAGAASFPALPAGIIPQVDTRAAAPWLDDYIAFSRDRASRV